MDEGSTFELVHGEEMEAGGSDVEATGARPKL